jgi:hypothetical protein
MSIHELLDVKIPWLSIIKTLLFAEAVLLGIVVTVIALVWWHLREH